MVAALHDKSRPMSTIATNQTDLYHAIKQSFAKLYTDYQLVPHDLARQCGVEGNIKNTQISVCDTLAYLIGWGKLVLKWYHARRQGLSVDMPETGFKWNQLGMLALHFYHQYQTWSYQELLDEYADVIKQILQLVRSLSDDELYGDDWYQKWTLGRMIQFNTSSPLRSTRTKVRRYMRSQGLL